MESPIAWGQLGVIVLYTGHMGGKQENMCRGFPLDVGRPFDGAGPLDVYRCVVCRCERCSGRASPSHASSPGSGMEWSLTMKGALEPCARVGVRMSTCVCVSACVRVGERVCVGARV